MLKEIFLDKLPKDFLGRYRYDQMPDEFITYNKIQIWCEKHQEFFMQTASWHMSGGNCPKCAKENRIAKQRLSKEQILDRFHKVFPIVGEYNYSELPEVPKNVMQKIFITHKCGHRFEMAIIKHMSGQKCPICAIKENAENHRIPIETQKERGRKIHNDEYNYSEFPDFVNSMHDLLWITHIECKNRFQQTLNNHLNNKNRCPVCSKKEGAEKRKTTPEQAVEIINNIFGVGKYTILNIPKSFEHGNRTRIEIKHEECETVFHPVLDSILNKHGCPVCAYIKNANNRKISHDEIKKIIETLYGENEYDLNSMTIRDVINKGRYITIKHKCGNAYEKNLHKLLYGSGCKFCKKSIEVLMVENFIKSLLMQNYQDEKMFLDLKNPDTNRYLRYDNYFELLNFKFIVEYDDISHYAPILRWTHGDKEKAQKDLEYRQWLDHLKDEFAFFCGIHLLRIPYWIKSKDEIEMTILNFIKQFVPEF